MKLLFENLPKWKTQKHWIEIISISNKIIIYVFFYNKAITLSPPLTF